MDLSWGNPETVLLIIDKIAKREGIGNILAEGTKKAARIIGRDSEKYAMEVKGLELIGGDPRGQIAFALGYATSNRGADHLYALPVFEYFATPDIAKKMFGSEEAANRLGVKGKGRLVRWQEDLMAVIDSINVCKLAYASFASSTNKILSLGFGRLARLYSLGTGFAMDKNTIIEIGERIVNLERAFNAREGLTRKDDVLPSRFVNEPLTEGSSAGNVVKLETMLTEYYADRGWDVKTGLPTKPKLEELGLINVAEELERLGRTKKVK
jgi:aldehyde:ferredoxin oxidoreductase